MANRQDIKYSVEIESFESEDFRVISFDSEERISSLYNIRIEFASTNAFLSMEDLIDLKVSLLVEHRKDGEKWFHGIISSAVTMDSSRKWHAYEINVTPSLNRLSQRTNCRIFQQNDVSQIVDTIFKEHGIVDYKWVLYEKHIPREYCVQYRESDYDFVKRVLAEEGISFYFAHEKDRHLLFMSDATIMSRELDDKPVIEYNAKTGGTVKDTYIQSFKYTSSVKPVNFQNNDRFFKTPAYSLIHEKSNPNDSTRYNYNQFDYPARFKEDIQGKSFTKFWMESVTHNKVVGEGRSNSIHLCPGYKFELAAHENENLNKKYLLLEVFSGGAQPQSLEEEAGEGSTSFSTFFRCIPAKTPYRPLQRQTRPKVDGPQIATVVGPAGEEIFCDEYARVKVQFPWDRYGKSDEHSSCWVRISNISAGQGWGQFFLPRIGQEVIVDFLEGDPDQPIITGRTYHAANMPPYKLPDNKTRSTIKSKTHKGQGSNEMRFEDQVGQEEYYMHAQKDMNTMVLNNQSNTVNVDRAKSIGNNETSSIGNDRTESVGNNEKITVGVDRSEQVGNNEQIAIGNNRSEQVGVNENISIGSNQSLNVGSNQSIEVGSSRSKSVGGNESVTIGMNKVETIVIGSMENVGAGKALSVGGGYQVSVGALKNESVGLNSSEQVGKTKKITAGKRYELKVGASSIILNSDGTIILQGKEIKIAGSKHVEIDSKLVDIN